QDAAAALVGLEAPHQPLAPDLGKPQQVGQESSGWRTVVQHQRHTVKSADRMVDGNVAALPRWLGLGTWNANQGSVHAIGIDERQSRFAKTLFNPVVGDAFLNKAMRPIAERGRGHAKCGLLRLTDTRTSLHGVLPGEEREDRTGVADLVAIVKVIGRRIIEVDRFLHEAKPENAGVEVEVALRLSRDGGHVMNAGHCALHISERSRHTTARGLLTVEPSSFAGNIRGGDQTTEGPRHAGIVGVSRPPAPTLSRFSCGADADRARALCSWATATITARSRRSRRRALRWERPALIDSAQ